MKSILIKYQNCAIMFVCTSFIMMNAGCNAPKINNTELQHNKPKYSLNTITDPNETFAIDAYDPWEKYNRTMYKYNAVFDRKVFLPAVSAYHTITTQPMRDGIHNAFSNLGELSTLINAVIQGNLKSSWITTQRIAINSTIGVLGLFDAATEDYKLIKQNHDFGQTLAHYGAKPGPYMILPLLGPSTLRDTIDIVGDYVIILAIDPIGLYDQEFIVRYSVEMLNSIAIRDNIDVKYYQSQSPFEYDMVRFLYLKARNYQIAQ